VRGDCEILDCPFSPPNKPIDAAANEKHGETCAYERAWSATNAASLIVIVPSLIVTSASQRWNGSEGQQQDNRQKHVLH
jgi:hypothetical protein